MMTKKTILFAVIIACLTGLVFLSRWESKPPPPALPGMGPAGTNPGGPSYENEKIMAPDFSLTDLHGQKITLSELRGKVVIINFWSSRCPPCIMEMPSFIKLQNAMYGKPFQLLAITDDSPGTARNISDRLGLNFTVLPDPQGIAARLYGVFASPVTFIILPDGTINDRFMGAANWSDQSVIDYLDRLIQRHSAAAAEG